MSLHSSRHVHSLNDCHFECCRQIKTMDSSKSWNSIKATFASFTPTKSTPKRKRHSVKPRSSSTLAIQRIVSPSKSFPQTTIGEKTVACELSREQPKKTKIDSLNCTPHRPTDRCQAGSSRSAGHQNASATKPRHSTSSIMDRFRLFRNGRGVKEQDSLDYSIIDPDSDDDDDDAGTHRLDTDNVMRKSMPFKNHFTNTEDESVASQPIIESVSSFGSFPTQQEAQVAGGKKPPKRPKITKGGLTELLQKSVNQSKSDHAFWMNERQMPSAASGEKVLIQKIERSFGRILVHCTSPDGTTNDVRIFLLDPASKKLPFIGVGKIIEIDFNTTAYRLDSHTLCYPYIINILIHST